MDTIIDISGVFKSYRIGEQEVPILKNINMRLVREDFTIIFGPSGCGKSTLLHIVLGLETPTKGSVNILNTALYDDTHEDERSDFRKKHIGMVYQQPNWIKSLTVIENTAFPLMLMGNTKVVSLDRAMAALDLLGMKNWASYTPTELSSGQQQKVALARALVSDPEVIIADEPTGNLDYESGQELMQLLGNLRVTKHKTILMVTHDLDYLKYSHTAVHMFNGEIVGTYDDANKTKLMKSLSNKRGEAHIEQLVEKEKNRHE